jgi:hypothetical protein
LFHQRGTDFHDDDATHHQQHITFFRPHVHDNYYYLDFQFDWRNHTTAWPLSTIVPYHTYKPDATVGISRSSISPTTIAGTGR